MNNICKSGFQQRALHVKAAEHYVSVKPFCNENEKMAYSCPTHCRNLLRVFRKIIHKTPAHLLPQESCCHSISLHFLFTFISGKTNSNLLLPPLLLLQCHMILCHDAICNLTIIAHSHSLTHTHQCLKHA